MSGEGYRARGRGSDRLAAFGTEGATCDSDDRSQPTAPIQRSPSRTRHDLLCRSVQVRDPEGARPYLGALLLAYYDDAGGLIYAGRAGTGIADAELADLGRLGQVAQSK
jgi:hypothetical protein